MADLHTRRFTYEDLCRLPEDGKRRELIEGQMIVSPSPRPSHQDVSGKLFLTLALYARETNAGRVYYAPVDIVLSDVNVLVPDLIFIRAERTSIVGEKYVDGPPDLVIEISSPSTRKRDYTAKLKLYGRFGVKEYWIVDPEIRRVEIFTLEGSALRKKGEAGEGDTFGSDLLPDLSISVDAIFG